MWIVGTDPQIRAAVRAAVRIAADAGGLPDDVVRRVAVMNGWRRRLWTLDPTRAMHESVPDPAGAAGVTARRLWWLLVVVLAAGTLLASLLLVASVDESVWWVVAATACAVLAVAAGLDLVLPRRVATADLPSVDQAFGVLVFAVTATGIVAATSSAASGAPGWATAIVGAALATTFAAAVVLGRRSSRDHRRGAHPTVPHAPANLEVKLAEDALREAHRLARLPRDEGRRRSSTLAWQAALGEMDRYLPQEVRDVAGALSPVAFIVWVFHDGRFDVSPNALAPLRGRRG
ncbi:hypothetical protein C8046_14170 [Serinibacter arcticus]|uniref:Uncharacterized protein n=1 Tax=Serinibacter arcticus TaxID=1655435 RepID=A0A2U1ZXC6_9MICO|nr:hypothetical protein C8046_14170 [Serinibacter arcticus]